MITSPETSLTIITIAISVIGIFIAVMISANLYQNFVGINIIKKEINTELKRLEIVIQKSSSAASNYGMAVTLSFSGERQVAKKYLRIALDLYKDVNDEEKIKEIEEWINNIELDK